MSIKITGRIYDYRISRDYSRTLDIKDNADDEYSEAKAEYDRWLKEYQEYLNK